MLFKNIKDELEQSFGFSLCVVYLLAILVIYFRMRLRDLADGKLLESGKVYYHQYWKYILVLVNFQNN